MRPAPRVGVVAFPGSHDAAPTRDVFVAMGAEVVALGPDDGADALAGLDVVVLSGGWSYGDEPRPGARAAATPVVAAARDFAGTVIGIGNGFQILCEADLLPGGFAVGGAIECDGWALRIDDAASPLTRGMRVGESLTLPVKGRAIRWSGETGSARVVLRGNGGAVAALTDATGRIAGIVAHPEYAVDPDLGATDGQAVIAAILGVTS